MGGAMTMSLWKSVLRTLFVAGLSLLPAVPQPEAAIITGYPAAPGYDFSSFGLAGNRFVREYRQLNGAAGGGVINFNMDVLDNDPDPNEKDPLINGMEKIGTLNFQYILWRGSSGGAGGPIEFAGAGILAGFQRTGATVAG